MIDYAALPSFVLGFHGCDAKVMHAVINGRRTLRESRNPFDWLGQGVYFWESDATRAFEWAEELHRRGKVERPSVVGAIIDLGVCLNLLDRAYVEMVRVAHQHLLVVAEQTGSPTPQNRPLRGVPGLPLRNLDCATINVCRPLQIDRGLTPFDTVRAAFIEGEPLDPTAGFHDRNHIQLCVVNPACIKGYFRPLPGRSI